ncbi:MAG: hypothetical protein SGPRY_005631, partial [Prymnesium sp.]
AVLKQQVTRDITNGKVLTASGYISCPAEVAEHLRARFSTAEWREAHKNKHIHEIIIFYSPHQEITRPRGDNNFDALDAGNELICDRCIHRDNKPAWIQQTVRNLGTGLAGRRKEAQDADKKYAQMLKACTSQNPGSGFLAIQASQELALTCSRAVAPAVLDVRKIPNRCTIEGVMFGAGDYLVRIGTHFDRVASDASGLTFEEWTPSSGATFVVNATEIRGVNFTMTPTTPGPPLVEVRRSGRRAAVVSTPPLPKPKEYEMDPLIDDEIPSRCW